MVLVNQAECYRVQSYTTEVSYWSLPGTGLMSPWCTLIDLTHSVTPLKLTPLRGILHCIQKSFLGLEDLSGRPIHSKRRYVRHHPFSGDVWNGVMKQHLRIFNFINGLPQSILELLVEKWHVWTLIHLVYLQPFCLQRDGTVRKRGIRIPWLHNPDAGKIWNDYVNGQPGLPVPNRCYTSSARPH